LPHPDALDAFIIPLTGRVVTVGDEFRSLFAEEVYAPDVIGMALGQYYIWRGPGADSVKCLFVNGPFEAHPRIDYNSSGRCDEQIGIGETG
jgi:hypothetical protein